MARIQVVPLPAEKAGAFESTPFILVIDQWAEPISEAGLAAIKASTGARTVVAWDGDLDAPGALEITPEVADVIISKIST